MFDVLHPEHTVDSDSGYVFVRKYCSCDPKLKSYLTNTTFTVRDGGGNKYVYDLIADAYAGLAYLPGNDTVARARKARVGAVVAVRLFCGCCSGLWNYLMSYVMKEEDSVASFASRFGVSMDSIELVNGIQNPDNFTAGSVYYIPSIRFLASLITRNMLKFLLQLPVRPRTLLQKLNRVTRAVCNMHGS